ncbi:hypothetical protein BJY24_004668 [Nocardia transvalensis]|uniref:DUF8175 domain-containing protein n=1 Tax=Nocardia transvalensis TaxID=37333 RepID=A0A7W9PGS6_9NOCA|nr:hypothetical protein [Nocardia transvalensis]MBB5915756.1 hypothetical protein [Nocardia transvalensis]
MVSGPGPGGAGGGISVRLLGFAAVLTVALAVTVTVVTMRRDGHATVSAADPTPVVSTSAVAAAPGFGPADADMFGRRVDIPNDPAGQPLAQDPAAQRRPDDPQWLTAAPSPVQGEGVWQRIFGGPVVRFSASDGPSRIEGKAAVGYAHTPQGAVLAAEQHYWRTNANPTDRELLLRLVAASPEYLAEYDRLVAAGKVSQRLPEKLTPLLFASDAFRVESYTDDHAMVDIARKAREVIDGQPTWVGTRLAVVWRDGDWKLTAVNGQQLVRIDSLRSIEGWTTW